MERKYLCLAHMSGNEQKYVQEAFDTNWVVPLGPNVNAFEEELARFCKSKPNNIDFSNEVYPQSIQAHNDNPDELWKDGYKELEDKEVVALCSGTSAIHLALINLGVKVGDEVICQSFTFCASSHPVMYLGATPVFVDSEVDTWNMSPELLERAIKDRIEKTGRKPKAIIVVYLYGMPAKIKDIIEIFNSEIIDYDKYKKYIEIRLDNSLWREEYQHFYNVLLAVNDFFRIKDSLIIEDREELREIFKDEVRQLGLELGLSRELVFRHPFPGPGLAIRIMGEVNTPSLELLRKADVILRDELKSSGWYNKTWQAFCVLLNVHSVGVMGDNRTYENAVCIRVVDASDGMTASFSRLPYDLLENVSRRIINEVDGINRVVYDISSKPPATIEWE